MGKTFLYGQSLEKSITDLFAKLTVRCPIDAVVRVKSIDSPIVYDTKTDINGDAVFDRITSGYWDVTLVDVENAPVRRIKIDSLDYVVNINGFVSTINITYPVGSICTITDSSNTYIAPNTSGSWSFTVYNTGTWTVSCTDGERVISTTAAVSSNGQNVPVTLKYFEGTINITYTEGCECTCSLGNVTYTAPDRSGSWTCTVPNAGTWLITVIGNGSTKSNTVTVTNDGQIIDSRVMLFEAYITVVYTPGSVCSCSDGETLYHALDTSGSYTFLIPHTGTWTVECQNDAGEIRTSTIQITEDGQHENVELSYALYLYNSGNEYDSITGGWTATSTRSTASNSARTPTLTKSNVLSISLSSSYGTYRGSVAPANNYFDLTNYSKLIIETTSTTTGLITVVFTTSNSDGYNNNMLASISLQNTAAGIHTLDIAEINRSCYLFISVETNSSNRNTSTNIGKVYLE